MSVYCTLRVVDLVCFIVRITITEFFLMACVRALAHGEDLLQGMLSADIVGFHAFDHARSVLSRQVMLECMNIDHV